LIAEGVLAEIKSSEAALVRRGRPQVALGLNPAFASVVAVVLTLNRLSVTLISYDGSVADRHEERLPTLTMGRDELVASVGRAVRRLVERTNHPPLRVALALQGITHCPETPMLLTTMTPTTTVTFGPVK